MRSREEEVPAVTASVQIVDCNPDESCEPTGCTLFPKWGIDSGYDFEIISNFHNKASQPHQIWDNFTQNLASHDRIIIFNFS